MLACVRACVRFLFLFLPPPREEAPHILYGSRAAARLGLGRAEDALADAEVSPSAELFTAGRTDY